MATTQELIEKINTKIEALIDNPEVDYKEGDVSVSAGQKIKQLQAMRESLLAGADADLALVAFDIDINEFGEDKSQRVL